MADLKHYGIIGMRWGHRKGRGPVPVGKGIGGAAREVGGLLKDAALDDISKARSLGRKVASAVRAQSPSVRASEDHKIAQMLKKKRVSELSNDEIRKITTRLQLEKQLKDITAADKARGGRFIKGLLSSKFANEMIGSLIKGAAEAARRRRAEQGMGE